MRDVRMNWFACVLGSSALAGCSLFYNPDNLPSPASDAHVPPPDQPTLVNAGELALKAAGPRVLLEGQGAGGSRQAILAILGTDIAQGAMLALVPSDGSTGPMITVDNAHAVRSLSGTGMAVPITIPVDPSRSEGEVKLTVKISQAGPQGEVTAALDDQVTLRYLPELEPPVAASPTLAPLYSRIKLSAALAFAPKANGSPVVIRAVSSIDLGDVHVDAAGKTPGPAGGAGGAAGAKGQGLGAGLPAAVLGLQLGVVVAASGGGYGEAGGPGRPVVGTDATPGGPSTGDDLLLAFASDGGSGGGGGTANPGGGGGGSLEITAGGTLKTGAISASGGTGGADALLSGAGGGGSGGAIVLRAGSTATLGTVTANGGAGGDHSATGAIAGAGGGGRLRYDVPMLAGTPALPAARRRGVSFDTAAAANPLATTDAQQGVAVTGEVSASAASNVFDVYVFNAETATTDAQTVTLVTPSVILRPKLSPGYNRVCVTPHTLNPLAATTATNCLDIAYVP